MKISVCIATYNGEAYLREQMDSILIQIGDNDEVIVSDDSSTDKTIEILKSYNDKRIIIYENQKFKSPIFNFENALQYAKGDYVFLADQDDIWMPNKVIIFKKFLKNYNLVLSDADIINESGKVIQNSFYEINGSESGFMKNIIKNSYLGCTMAFNQKILERSLPFPKDTPMHDWWIGMVAEVYGDTYFISEKLISYRRHSDNASPAGEKSHYSFFKKISFRLIMIKNLILKCPRLA